MVTQDVNNLSRLSLIFFVVTYTKSSPNIFRSPTLSQQIEDLHLLPCKASNGVICMLAWKLLYANSINKRWVSQLHFKSITQVLNISSKVCIVLFDYPSIWGWKEVFNFSLIPITSSNLPQKRKVNRGLGRNDVMSPNPNSDMDSYRFGFGFVIVHKSNNPHKIDPNHGPRSKIQ